MPTWTWGLSWTWALWNLAGFMGALVVNCFIEYGAHKFVMHRLNWLIPYGYKHTTSHHAIFGADETYHAIREGMLEHGIGFTIKEYALFPIACSFLYLPAEFLIGRPVYVGAILAVFAGLIAFDVLHRRFHNPKDTWFQRTGVFRFLKQHHRIHHADMSVNLNVVAPLVDLLMGTLRRT